MEGLANVTFQTVQITRVGWSRGKPGPCEIAKNAVHVALAIENDTFTIQHLRVVSGATILAVE
jgi:hypothetical protein